MSNAGGRRPHRLLRAPAGSLPGGEPVSLIQVAIEPMPDPAGEEALARSLEAILAEVAAANADFPAMKARVREAARAIEDRARVQADAARAGAEREGAALLDWLCDGNFIFLGLREFAYHPRARPCAASRAAISASCATRRSASSGARARPKRRARSCAPSWRTPSR